jgi:2,4-dienoyl-CoA reductase-like NADH-dependent reductase (Old Yellow Enzyme family)
MLQPFQLGNLNLPNRLVMLPSNWGMGTNMGKLLSAISLSTGGVLKAISG